jgi:hypothetical protein
MKALKSISLLLWASSLALLLEGCVYQPFPLYTPRYGYHPHTYLDEEPYAPAPRRMRRQPREREVPEAADDYPPPSRDERTQDKPVEPKLTEKDKTPPPLAKDPVSKPKSDVLTATRTSNPNRVKSPYPPYNELDVSGLPSGSLAKDPSTGEKFRVP